MPLERFPLSIVTEMSRTLLQEAGVPEASKFKLKARYAHFIELGRGSGKTGKRYILPCLETPYELQVFSILKMAYSRSFGPASESWASNGKASRNCGDVQWFGRENPVRLIPPTEPEVGATWILVKPDRESVPLVAE